MALIRSAGTSDSKTNFLMHNQPQQATLLHNEMFLIKEHTVHIGLFIYLVIH